MTLDSSPTGSSRPPKRIGETGPLLLGPDVLWWATHFEGNQSVEVYKLLFATGAVQPTGGQLQVIKNDIAPLLHKPDVYVEIYSRTDRTGTNERNFQVAGQRLASVQAALTAAGAPLQQVYANRHKNLGEEWAATYEDDDVPDPNERCVVIYVWSNPFASQRMCADGPFLQFARAF